MGNFGFTAAVTLHELGHTLGLGEENCEITSGPMCNGPTPQLSTQQRTDIFERRCAWVRECANPDNPRPPIAPTPTPDPGTPPAVDPADRGAKPRLYVRVVLVAPLTPAAAQSAPVEPEQDTNGWRP